MKVPPFTYRKPESLDEALALLADNAGAAQVLAGGQSLIPTLNMRLSALDMLVDINHIDALRDIAAEGESVRIGALVRHVEVLESPLVVARVPLLAKTMQHVADMAVRNHGTICGGIALADPSAEMPAVAVALDAQIHLRSRDGARDVSARDFFEGLYQTARRDDEMITAVSFPCAQKNEVFGFAELSRRHGDFAIVGVAVTALRTGDIIDSLTVVIFGSEPKPLLSSRTGGLSIGRHASDHVLRDMAHAVAAEMEPMGNHQGRADTKRLQGAALLQRVLRDLQKGLANGRGPFT